MIRGSIDNIMDNMERAINDGVNTFKALTRDNKLVSGAGATEIELAKQITTLGESTPGLEQYAIKKYAEALEVVPRTIAENAGVKAQGAGVTDAAEKGLFDLYLVKYLGLKFATAADCTVLKVDQIIMARAAGGPKARGPGARDEDD